MSAKSYPLTLINPYQYSFVTSMNIWVADLIQKMYVLRLSLFMCFYQKYKIYFLLNKL